MNVLDILLAALLLGAAYSGFKRGAVLQLLTYGGLLLGLFLGALLAPPIAGLASAPATQAALAAATFLVLGGAGDLGGWLLGWKVRQVAHGTRFRPADAAGGVLVSAAAVLLSTWFVALNLVNGPFTPVAREIQGSTIVRALDATLPEPPSLLGQVRRFLNQYGFPEVFDGLPPAPAGPVKEPTQEEAQDAFEAAATSTVRIVGAACDRVVEGTGFVVAPNQIMTNAHVVAGTKRPKVQVPNVEGDVDATVVFFDPGVDVALLRVPQTPGPPLDLLEDMVRRGERGAVLGYPGGGQLAGTKAAVIRSLVAEGSDIYHEDDVVRNVYELQTSVEPGDSGGPFVLVDGTVAGMVFAASTTDLDRAYAITSPQLLRDAGRALGRTTAVSTGECIR
ncbi:MAG TPA: MarP family serine protease [Actinomycetota bacterium]|nr:MarP family serine protease [Actinomycetota bacterium]